MTAMNFDRQDGPAPGEAFHAGERAIQARFGVRERLAQTGPRVIRPFMPEQHREFFAHLSYVLIGASDPDDRVWASILFGQPGFVTSPDPKALRIDAHPHPADPVGAALQAGASVGVLGIDLATRRRNRANGRVLPPNRDNALHVGIDQSFGNCPQYIWPRQVFGSGALTEGVSRETAERTRLQDDRVNTLIARADTFFIASRHRGDPSSRTNGIDVSHRGGRPGFLHLERDAILWPEYRGNFYFNTLGNIATDSACGLLIPDFETGDLLQLTGPAEIVWPENGAVPTDGHLRVNGLVRFTPSAILLRAGVFSKEWRRLGGAQCADGPL
jgi:predicted pyridoxine 5'-phosphate oxidase superfamily flavin-nucleotide-binding protein